ncbi:HAMP domain-containing sensor histidine kinase [Paenibacillus radicis (ex Xue et al. 2023)]|uniref:Signal transduction histidine-protein kinase ArlS n=1 Tax=Paenibacillus radicis (ex Xue et al. 2023) TaxID=2972489 RepID=A0ABT1YGE0_9BACL|nr:ATP-binding protein [Paenibacillus radicis (ex Xue et al. 2023)]MCR8632268.1 ATP-binding protein [Paenibacillus radicis (ex Xue et al. 2023)]
MKRLPLQFAQIPIKWKLTIWSTLLLVLLFAVYNIVQYAFVERWMIKQEETNTQQDMREILNYFLENEVSFEEGEFVQARNFLERINRPDQLIRVLNEKGEPILTVSDDIPEQWVEAKAVSTKELVGIKHTNDRLVIMRSPLTIFKFNGTVEIIKNIVNFEKLTDALFYVMVLCGLGAVVISGLGGRLLAGQLLKPLQGMAETIRNIKQKGLHERMQLNNNKDEIATLMVMFNTMMDQVERSFQQQRQFVEDASHELRTPVAIVEGHLSLLQRWGKHDPAILEESLNASIQEVARLKMLVQELLALSRAEKLDPEYNSEVTDPEQAIRTIIKNMAVLHPTFDIQAELEPLESVLAISPQHLEQILLIVLDNAVKYSEQRKLICVRATVNEEAALIEVIDSGIGIAGSDMPYIMDRFYRADKARSGEQAGHGLGLAIAKRLVEIYNGTITLQSIEHEGTTVCISLPKR